MNALTVNAFPNPFNGEVNVKIESNLTDNADVMLYDITGRVMTSMPAQAVNSTISLGHDLAPGMYIIEVKQAGMSKMVKVIKN